jgi:hypothetical protein
MGKSSKRLGTSPKPLTRNDLGRRGGGGHALTPLISTTYDDLDLFLKIFSKYLDIDGRYAKIRVSQTHKENEMTYPEILKLEKGIGECVLLPKTILPEPYRGKRSHRSLKSVIKQARKRGAMETEHAELKRIKAEKIAKYSAEFAEKGSFTYEENADKLYRHQQAFCSAYFTSHGIDLDEE